MQGLGYNLLSSLTFSQTVYLSNKIGKKKKGKTEYSAKLGDISENRKLPFMCVGSCGNLW